MDLVYEGRNAQSLPLSFSMTSTKPKTPPQSTRADGLPIKDLPPTTPSGQRTLPHPMTTPIAHRQAGANPYGSTLQEREARFRAIAREGRHRFVGPMPVQSFLDSFMPRHEGRSESTGLQLVPIHSGELPRMSKLNIEAEVYDPMSHVLSRIMTNFTVMNCSKVPANREGMMSPDICILENHLASNRMLDFSRVSMYIELKSRAASDPFVNLTKGDVRYAIHGKTQPRTYHDADIQEHKTIPFTKDSQQALEVLGQIMTYANAQFTTQTRLFVFSVLICGPLARFIRWDRSGAIVTEAFHYGDHPDLFLEFFRRYNRMIEVELGFDPTVLQATEAESAPARTLLQLHPATSMLKFGVPSRKGKGMLYYIAERPSWKIESPFGRGSRAFPAWSVLNRALVYLKDYWRYTEPGIDKETSTYECLHAAEVPYIPRLDEGDDLGYQTITHLFVDRPWAMKTETIFKHFAFRMTLGDVGTSLTEFRCSKDYVTAIMHAIEAHHAAFYKAGILHRDISVGNILIHPGGGLLIDWELSKKVEKEPASNPDRESQAGAAGKSEATNPPRREYRTGTWQFISAMILQNIDHPHGYLDDLESFFWVLLWVSLCYIQSNQDPSNLRDMLKQFDERCNSTTEGGGKQKKLRIQLAYPDLLFSALPALQNLIQSCADLLAWRYRKPPLLEDIEEMKALLATVSEGSTMPKIWSKTPAFLYLQHLKRTPKDIKTMIYDYFAQAVASTSWPHNDKATPRPIDRTDEIPSAYKRTLDETRFRQQKGSQRKRAKTEFTLHPIDEAPATHVTEDNPTGEAHDRDTTTDGVEGVTYDGWVDEDDEDDDEDDEEVSKRYVSTNSFTSTTPQGEGAVAVNHASLETAKACGCPTCHIDSEALHDAQLLRSGNSLHLLPPLRWAVTAAI